MASQETTLITSYPLGDSTSSEVSSSVDAFVSIEPTVTEWTQVTKKPKKINNKYKHVNINVDNKINEEEFVMKFAPIVNTCETVNIISSTGISSNKETVVIPNFVGGGASISYYSGMRALIAPLLEKLSTLDRVLKNEEHQNAYHDNVVGFINTMTNEPTTTSHICMLDFQTGTGKTTIGTIISLLRVLNYDEQLVVIVPSIMANKKMSVASVVADVLTGLIDKAQVLNIALDEKPNTSQFYRVIISTPKMLDRVGTFITKRCTIFADELDFYINDKDVIIKTLLDDKAEMSFSNIEKKYNNIRAVYSNEFNSVQFKKDRSILACVTLIFALNEDQSNQVLKLQLSKKLKSAECVEFATKLSQDYKDKVLRKAFLEQCRATLTQRVNAVISVLESHINDVRTAFYFYLRLLSPDRYSDNYDKQPFNSLQYVINENNILECISYMDGVRDNINNIERTVKFVKFNYGELYQRNYELDKFCGFYQNINPSMMVCSSATLNVGYMGWYPPNEIIKMYLSPEHLIEYNFKHITSPIDVFMVNIASVDVVDRITGDDSSRRQIYGHADIFSAKALLVSEVCCPIMKETEGSIKPRILIQCKGRSLNPKTGEIQLSQHDIIEEALTTRYYETGEKFTSDPTYYNDTEFGTIISTIEETDGLRGLNFPVTDVIMCEVGNMMNIRSLLQALRIGRMCYAIDETMRVVVFYRGYKCTDYGDTEEAVATKFANILSEKGCNIRNITLNRENTPDRRFNTKAPWTTNIFTGEEFVAPPSMEIDITRDITPINNANRPLVCACVRPNCHFLHVGHYIDSIKIREQLAPRHITRIKKAYDTYKGYVPACMRLRESSCPKCYHYKVGQIQTEACVINGCSKLHYTQDENGIQVYNGSGTPLHLFCKKAKTDAFCCNALTGGRCRRRVVDSHEHTHDCQYAHCEEDEINWVSNINKKQVVGKTHKWQDVSPSTSLITFSAEKPLREQIHDAWLKCGHLIKIIK